MIRYSKIAITIPPNDLAALDHLAAQLDRSRSWVAAEAIRRFVVGGPEPHTTLDASRRSQLHRDLTLTAEQRVRDAERVSVVPRLTKTAPEEPRRFATYDDFAEWRRLQRDA